MYLAVQVQTRKVAHRRKHTNPAAWLQSLIIHDACDAEGSAEVTLQPSIIIQLMAIKFFIYLWLACLLLDVVGSSGYTVLKGRMINSRG
jgi:hypothetical protein